MKIPLIGLGTYKLLGEDCINAVKTALEIGYRHFDTAFSYENHREIAEAIQGYDRSALFLTTKLAIGLGQIEDTDIETSLESAVDTALKELKTDYIDLLLIHWPDKSRPMEKILSAMYKLVDKGKIHSPGVSNYTKRHLQDAYDAGLSIPYNQVEFHPYLYQKELLDFARAHGTELIAYRSFGGGKLIDQEPLFASIGEKYGKTPSQVILRWTIQKNIPVIPKASSKKHLEENFALQDFTLTPSEEAALDGLNKNFRYCTSEWNEFDY